MAVTPPSFLCNRLFAWLYGVVGRQADVVMTNSTWTLGNIKAIWRIPERTGVVYPPCDTQGFMTLPLTDQREPGKIVSVAQFRPEKDHSLQVILRVHLRLFADQCAACGVPRGRRLLPS